MKKYSKALNDLIMAISESYLPPMKGQKLFDFNTSASLCVELMNKINQGLIKEESKVIENPVKKTK